MMDSSAAPFRRTRAIWVVLVASACLLLYLGSPLLGFGSTSSTAEVKEIDALLHMVTTSDQQLSAVDGNQELPLSTYAVADVTASRKDVKQLYSQYPLVVFSKTYCPYSKKGKALLEFYDIVPPPKIIELDLRQDQMTMKTLLTRLTGRGTVPNVVLKGTSIGGSDDIQAMHARGQLREVLEHAGLQVRGNV